ncbi:unnamed protein product [Adineta steineri]|uniref:Uncharacterized protein n=1 Tax=Adineta steineri TaxID=433720 RepID=A0A818TAU8_9BILA|nr:unnamed protein product [Adineta steineri]
MEKRFNNNNIFAKSTIEFKQSLADVVNDNPQLPPPARVPTQNPTAFTINDRKKLMCSLILASWGMSVLKKMEKRFNNNNMFAKSTIEFKQNLADVHRNLQHVFNGNPAPPPIPQQINNNRKKR